MNEKAWPGYRIDSIQVTRYSVRAVYFPQRPSEWKERAGRRFDHGTKGAKALLRTMNRHALPATERPPEDMAYPYALECPFCASRRMVVVDEPMAPKARLLCQNCQRESGYEEATVDMREQEAAERARRKARQEGIVRCCDCPHDQYPVGGCTCECHKRAVREMDEREAAIQEESAEIAAVEADPDDELGAYWRQSASAQSVEDGVKPLTAAKRAIKNARGY